MAEDAAAAIHIDDIMIEAELLHGDHGDNGEGFVDFPQLDITGGPARFIQRLFHGVDGGRGETRRFMRVGGVGDDFGEDFMSAFFRVPAPHQNERRRAARRVGLLMEYQKG